MTGKTTTARMKVRQDLYHQPCCRPRRTCPSSRKEAGERRSNHPCASTVYTNGYCKPYHQMQALPTRWHRRLPRRGHHQHPTAIRDPVSLLLNLQCEYSNDPLTLRVPRPHRPQHPRRSRLWSVSVNTNKHASGYSDQLPRARFRAAIISPRTRKPHHLFSGSLEVLVPKMLWASDDNLIRRCRESKLMERFPQKIT